MIRCQSGWWDQKVPLDHQGLSVQQVPQGRSVRSVPWDRQDPWDRTGRWGLLDLRDWLDLWDRQGQRVRRDRLVRLGQMDWSDLSGRWDQWETDRRPPPRRSPRRRRKR